MFVWPSTSITPPALASGDIFVFVLAVKEATEKLSYYWQQAFLIDHMLLAGYLEDGDSARRAQQAMQRTLEGSPRR